MKTRKIGNTDLEVSEISFGCWTMGGPNWSEGNPIGWADVDEGEVAEAIKLGLDAGVNHFDTADIYGNGKSERMLRRVFDKLGVKSESVIIASKLGHFAGTAAHAYEPLHIRRQCEQSLINLGRDYLDIYYFHHANFGESDFYLEDAAATMNDLVDEGKVRVKGQSAYSTADFLRVVPTVEPAVLQSSANVLHTEYIEEGALVQALMTERGMSFVAFSPLTQGLVLDKYDPKNPPKFEPGDHRARNAKFSAEGLAKLQPQLARLKDRFGATTQDLAAMAMYFDLGHPNVCCVIPGFRNPGQAACNIGAAGRDLSADDIAFIYDVFADRSN